MTRDDIIRMAFDAGFTTAHDVWPKEFDRFAALVAEAERKECAALAEKTICDTHIPTGVNIYGTRAAAAIRARGNT
jgi:hypothetical protein